MQSQKKKIFLIIALIVLAIVGFVFVWRLGIKQGEQSIASENSDTVTQTENALKQVNQTFYNQGMEFLAQYVETDYSSKAKEIGTESFFELMDKANEELLTYSAGAQNNDESILAQTVRDLCLYSLSTAAEEGTVEEIGGGLSEQDIERIKNRKSQSATWLEQLKKATTIEQIKDLDTLINA